MLFFKKKSPFLIFKSILFTALLITSNNLLAKDTITWQNPDFPPSYIKEGPFKGQGVGDSLYVQVFAYLDEYNHQTLIANFKRIIRDIEYKKNNPGDIIVCRTHHGRGLSLAYDLVS